MLTISRDGPPAPAGVLGRQGGGTKGLRSIGAQPLLCLTLTLLQPMNHYHMEPKAKAGLHRAVAWEARGWIFRRFF